MKKRIALLIIIVIIVTGIVIFSIDRQNAYRNSTIKVSGNIEATETRLSFQVSGRIKRIFVDEGDYIKKGQLVAMLDDEELTRLKEQAQANLEQAQSNYNLREIQYNRYSELLKNNAAAVQDKDVAQNNIEAAAALLNAARKALELANIRLNYTNLTSPIEGFVIVKSAEAGEVVQPGSVVYTVADLNDIWLTAYIIETDLGKVKLNQLAYIKTDSYPGRTYQGWLSFISEQAEFTPKFIQTTEERVKLVYRIKIAVRNPDNELKPGMPADGYINLE
jgi:HlyD family secretion protein